MVPEILVRNKSKSSSSFRLPIPGGVVPDIMVELRSLRTLATYSLSYAQSKWSTKVVLRKLFEAVQCLHAAERGEVCKLDRYGTREAAVIGVPSPQIPDHGHAHIGTQACVMKRITRSSTLGDLHEGATEAAIAERGSVALIVAEDPAALTRWPWRW